MDTPAADGAARQTQQRPSGNGTGGSAIRDAVRSYRARGLAVCLVKPGEKNPGYQRWPTLSKEPDDFGPDDNIGLICGRLNNDLVCVDLDSAGAVCRADDFLPPTGMIDGRPGKPLSHCWYRVTDIPEGLTSRGCQVEGGPATRQFRGPDEQMILELKGTGAQVVVPPSLWTGDDGSKERRRWDADGEPAEVSMVELFERAQALALACGWQAPPPPPPPPPNWRRSARGADRAWVIECARRYLLKRDPAVSRQNGHNRTFGTVCRIVHGFDLTREEAVEALGPWNRSCSPPWSEKELLHKIDDALKKAGERGYLIGSAPNDTWTGDAPGGHGGSNQQTHEPWEPPTPIGDTPHGPALPLSLFPDWLARYVEALATQTQTPTDMAGLTVLSAAAAGLAGKVRVRVRRGWTEPLNLFTVVALLPGERKSTVIDHCLAPVNDHERGELERLSQLIAEEQTHHRQLEKRLDYLEKQAAKAAGDELDSLRRESAEVARELATHRVPMHPQFVCDDVTSEALGRLLADQGGRMLLASAEGTSLEVLKGRYSESVSLEVYLKGHAGDDLRVNRVSRPPVIISRPALSIALAVQPDVIQGLADGATLKARGFLARFLYSVPFSFVGRRRIAAPSIPQAVADSYRTHMMALWSIPACSDGSGQTAPHWLEFSGEADTVLQSFESWLEPQLGQDGELFALAGWANKLAGACARIAAVLHVASAVGEGRDWRPPIVAATAHVAIRLGKDYLLPHAQAAFNLMGADERTEGARRVVAVLVEMVQNHQNHQNHSPLLEITRSRLQQHPSLKRHFTPADKLDPVLELLEKYGYLRPSGGGQTIRRGTPSPRFLVNPLLASEKGAYGSDGSDGSEEGADK